MITDNELKRKGKLIDEIVFQCKVNNVPSLDEIFINLACLEITALVKIAQELYIKT